MALRIFLTAVPFIWIIGALPWVNRVHPMIFGVPFLAFWIQLGVIISVFCIHALYTIDKKKHAKADAEAAEHALDGHRSKEN